ncbi:MAG: hypothetical protein ACKVOM_03960 [Ferruginibacter sp.]
MINPLAPTIDLPDNFPKKRRALPILLNIIETITFYHQYQREQKAEKDTGEVFIESTPDDVENGFKYLKNVLFRRSDELNGAVRDFYETLTAVLKKNELQKFKVSDIRKYITLTPRSIQGYLKELTEYNYLHITSGKQRTGYEYELLHGTSENQLTEGIEEHIKKVMERVNKAHQKKAKGK